jgi:thioredoxin 2
VRTVAERLAGKAAVVQINTQVNQSLAARFAVRNIPLLLLMRNGRVIDQMAGAQTVENVLSWFNHAAGISGNKSA